MGALVVCGILALVVAVPAAAHDVSMSRETFLIAEGAWGTLDPETYVGDQSVVDVQQMGHGDWYVGYQRIQTTAITCDMGTKFTADDEQGLKGTVAFGEGYADSIRFDVRRLRSVEATGTVEVAVYKVNTCDGSYEPTSDDVIVVSLDLDGDGRVRSTHDRMRWVEPGVSLEHSMFRMTSRPAVGTATVGGRVHSIVAGMGVIGRVRAIDHYLSH